MAKKKSKKKIIIGTVSVGSLFFVMTILVKRMVKTERVLSENGRFVSADRSQIYRTIGKHCLDKVISFISLVLLSPVFMVIGLAVYFDDPGPVFFMQKRVGKDKQLFYLHKFRTMKGETPHDIPTHQLENPEQYITKLGQMLRRTSLDELPQLWDILRGKMSIVGPRPALWNQDDLIAERDKYGANDIRPGLTGWAQINGRDELPIDVKARLDGEYVQKMCLGMDIRCIIGTVFSVLRHEGVVEGGTGAIQEKAGQTDTGKTKDGEINVGKAGPE